MTIMLIKGSVIQLNQGGWTFCEIKVHGRYNYDSSKRARNTAVRIDVKSLPYSAEGRTVTVSGMSFSVAEALKVLDDFGVSAAPLINLCRLNGWASELPAANSQGVLL